MNQRNGTFVALQVALLNQALEIVPRFSSQYEPRTRPPFLKNESVHSPPCLGVCIVQTLRPCYIFGSVPTLGSRRRVARGAWVAPSSAERRLTRRTFVAEITGKVGALQEAEPTWAAQK